MAEGPCDRALHGGHDCHHASGCQPPQGTHTHPHQRHSRPMAVRANQLGSHQVCLAGLTSPFACLSQLYCALLWVVVFSSSHHILHAGKTCFCTRAQVCSQLVSQHFCTPESFVQNDGLGILKVQAVYINSGCVNVLFSHWRLSGVQRTVCQQKQTLRDKALTSCISHCYC